MRNEAKPFLKWAGGKGQLLPQLIRHLPRNISEQTFTYVEPFVGGGAMLFYMLWNFPNIRRVVVNDVNPFLITIYRVVKDYPEQLIKELSSLEKQYLALNGEVSKKAFFLQVRSVFNQHVLSDVERAKYLIFLNRTCFNGLFRVNAKGAFNVPFGRQLHPTICNADTIMADSKLLNQADIVMLDGDFEQIEGHIDDGFNFIYFDPPYRPLDATSSFNAYAKGGFDDAEQVRLRDFCMRLNALPNVNWMLSNADCSARNPEDVFFETIYGGFNICRVVASRAINANPAKRGKLTELLIKNYD
ncbi:MAG: DNA adenine methylase [Prevotella sp.]|nr:DNA adenine methylase [Prevotella sp.]